MQVIPGFKVVALGLLLVAAAGCNEDGDHIFSLEEIARFNNRPTISGSPKTLTRAGEIYWFTPRASDPDGEPLRFQISNRPAWANFNLSTGTLSGTPAADDVGTFADVTISVSDGKSRKALEPFTIRVNPLGTTPKAPPAATPAPMPSGGDALMDLVAAAPAGSWIKVNRNRFEDVWTPKAQRASFNGVQVGEPRKIITAWGSMAWDANRRQLIIWGGGHADYEGNDVYRFDARTLRWERASLPSAVIKPYDSPQFFAADGAMHAPTSSHTYDNQEFLPLLDRFITFGGASYNAGKVFMLDDGVTPTGPYLWDPSRAGADMVGGTTGSQVNPAAFPQVVGGAMWDNRDSMVNNGTGAQRPDSHVDGTSARAFDSGVESLLVSEGAITGGDLFRYRVHSVEDRSLDEWQLVGVGSRNYSGQGAGAYDPRNRLYLRTARFQEAYGIVMWNVATPGADNEAIRFTPRDANGSPLITNLHGMDFDPVRSAFVLWDGSVDVWYLKPPQNAPAFTPIGWTMSRAPVSGAVGPSIQLSTGILGKWKYIASHDLMMGLGDGNEGQVWVYKPAGWQAPL